VSSTIPPAAAHPLRGPNRLKLGVFSANADGGLALTTVPERWRARWQDVVEVARVADSAALELFLPIARWKGFGGVTEAREWSFETFTFAAALSALTSRIAVAATVHVPLVHPVYAAKALATVDHVSGGRATLNIVCGWNPDEFAMFGQEPVEERYAQGQEWWEIVRRIHAGGPPFDQDGRFYRLRGVRGWPLPIQRPHPVTLNAAFGPPGRDFAARNVDFLLTTFTDLEAARRHIADIGARAAAVGREVGVWATCHVVCRASRAEAEAYYERYAVTEADHAAVDYHMRQKQRFASSHDEAAFRQHRKRFAGGAGTYPLVGTSEDIAAELEKIAAAGFCGTTLSFVDFKAELPAFCGSVLPRLVEAGLRGPA
jgi:alkanesulfonate monooxygenase SsuD/methylene tetrahydromethanopterin reductase-like flavin-dependent oxidoreductase (luciferase family)